jgi:cysteine-rich repeat protein
VESVCLDPAGDEDRDGLLNGVERALGTEVNDADSDGDGKVDAVEVGDPKSPTDTDGDGKLDAIESALLDADGDCVVDELDRDDEDPAVPGFACDFACDGVVEAGEACDDGNQVADDGCDGCVVVPLAVSRLEREPRQGIVAGLTSGGFLATWHEGRTAEAPQQAGHSVAFFDASGVEVRRHEDIQPPTTQVYYQKSATALRGGDVVVGSWFFDNVAGTQAFHVRRYTDVGEPVGNMVEAYVGTRFPADTLLVPVDAGAYAIVYVDPVVSRQLVIRYVDAAGNLSALERGRALRGTNALWLGAVGFRDGSVVVVTPEPDAEGQPALLAKRFGSAGTQVGEDVRVLPAGTSEAVFDVVAMGSDGYAVFFVTTDGATGRAVGYQKMSATDVRVGEPVYLVEDVTEGCVNGVAGAFHVGGEAFVAIEDGCSKQIRGWQEGANGTVAIAIAAATQPTDLYAVSMASFAGGAAVQYLYAPPDGGGAIFVTRIDRRGERALVTR